MFRSQRVRSAFLAGAVVVSILAGTGCKKNSDAKGTTAAPSESSEPIVTSLESESRETQESSSEKPETADTAPDGSSGEKEFKQEALKLAQELGVKEDELHGQYGLFLKYVDCIDQNTELGTLKDYVLHLFPVVADHLKPEDESYFYSAQICLFGCDRCGHSCHRDGQCSGQCQCCKFFHVLFPPCCGVLSFLIIISLLLMMPRVINQASLPSSFIKTPRKASLLTI